MTAELGFTSYAEGSSPEQEMLEARARARVNYGERLLRVITIEPEAAENVLTPIAAAAYHWSASNWLSRVKSIRGLQLVSSTPEVISGLLPTGQEIFLSGEKKPLGFRSNVFGVVEGKQLNKRKVRKLLRQFSSPLRERNQLMYRGS